MAPVRCGVSDVGFNRLEKNAIEVWLHVPIVFYGPLLAQIDSLITIGAILSKRCLEPQPQLKGTSSKLASVAFEALKTRPIRQGQHAFF